MTYNRVDVFSHSILKNAADFCPAENGNQIIEFHAFPGGQAYDIVNSMMVCARSRLQLELRTVFGIHVLQNTVAQTNGWSHTDMVEFRTYVRNFFVEEMNLYHGWFFILLDRPPELEHLFGNIRMINDQLRVEAGASMLPPCNPGKVLERWRRKGKYEIQNWRWREAENGVGPGYHPSNKSMYNYVRYIRRFVEHHFRRC